VKLLFCGDVVGRSGREAVLKYLPVLKEEHKLDVIVVNGENSAGGFGITGTISKSFFDIGVDIITTGNHVWRQKDVVSYISQEKRLLRPMNYSNNKLPGSGIGIHKMKDGRHFIVLHALARLYMPDLVDCPFHAIDHVLESVSLSQANVAGIMLDFHGEASSERMAMGHFLDGRVSLVVGTHTHVPTADHMILPNGTAYQTDAGMCGDYNSVIGMDKKVPIAKFLGKLVELKMSPAEGEATVCGTLVEISDDTGLATKITPIRVGGVLSQSRF
jgi:2',3'-cyclic-nucleotide 2'-phosphodiesterase